VTARRFFYFKSQNVKGIAQISIIVGLLIMAIAIPVVTRLSQQEQDTRQFAACPSAGSSCSGTQVTCCSTTKQQLVCTGGSWTVVANCPLGCEGNNCKPGCDYSFTNCKACGKGCAANEKSCYVTNNDCTKGWKCLNFSSQCVVNPTQPPSQNCGDHPNNSSWCDGSRRAYCSGGNTYFESCSYGCQANSSTWAVCAPAPTTKPSDPTPTPFCSPNSLKCQSNQQFKCNPLGTAWDFVHNCLGGCEGTLCKAYITNTPIPTNTSTPSSTNTPTSIPTRIPTAPICPSVGSSCSSTQVDCCQGYLYICTGGQWRSERCLTGCKDTQTCNLSCDYSILMDTCSNCGASGTCLSGQKKCTVQNTDCGRQDMCINFPSQCASDTTPTPLPTSLPDKSCNGHPNYSTWCQTNSQRGYCFNGISYFDSCSWGCQTESSIKASCKLAPTSVPNQPTPTLVCNPNAPVCKDNKQYRCNAIGTDMTFVHNCKDQCNGNLCDAYITNTPAPTCNGICKLNSPSTGFSSCSNYGMETSTGTCETGICCKYPPAYTCKSPNICRDTGGGRANCASYGQTDTAGTCPQGQVCCANKPTLPPSPTPTISNTKCSFDGKQYSVDAEICGSGGLLSRCKDGQKCTCTSNGSWQVITCPSGSCQAGKCTQPCLFQGKYYGPDKTVCDTTNNKAGTCSQNGQWIWLDCGSAKYCQDGLCLPKTCCCIRSVSTSLSSATETCQLYSGSSCSPLSSLTSPAYQADPSKCQFSQTSSVSSPTPTITPTSTSAINPSGVTEGGYCTGSMPVWCGGTPAKQYICTANTWRSVATCTNGCLGNRCTEVVNNCDYIILERKGQCGSYCPNLNEIQFKVQTGKRLTDGSCETAYRCYPRAECTVNTGCTNGQLNDAKWCFAGQPCTCQNGKIECGEYCTYGCLEGQCGSPQTVDQIKFTSNLTSEDFFTLSDQDLISKHCQNKGGTPDQIQSCLTSTNIENLLRDLDPTLESTIMDLRQATLRKLDYLNMDRQSLAQKYCNGIQSCITSFNPDSLLSGLTQQEIESIKQQKVDLEIQKKIQDFMTLSQQDLLSKYCQSNLSCINNFSPESLLSGLSQADRDRLIKQKQAAEILSRYQNTSLVSANTNISAEEERYLVGKCLELGGSCQDKQSALAFLLKLSSPDQSDSNYSYFLSQLEGQKQLRQDELDAYNRIAKTLTNLGIINPYTGLLDPKYQGQSFVELEQKLAELRSTDPAINAVIIYNNLTVGAAKRGIDIAYASDATTWDFIRGNLIYAAPAAGMAAGIGALALAAPFGGAAALTYLGTGMGISGTVNSLSYTAETCGGDNMDGSKCAMAVARTTFMAASTGIGVVSSSANLISQSTTNSGLLGLTGRLGTSSFATGTGIKVANTLVSAAGTGIFGAQTVQSYQQEGLSFNTFVNATIAVTSAGRFVSSLSGQGGLVSIAQITTTTVDNTSDLIQATVSCTSATSDMTRVEDCIRDMVALLNDASQLGQSVNAKKVLQQATDQTIRGNIADSDPVNRYLTEIAQRTSLDVDTEIARINALRQAQLDSNPNDIDGINARFDQQIEAYKTTQNRQIYDAARLLGRIQEDGLNIVLADDQGIPRPIADVQKEVETILAQRNPIIRDYEQQTKATIDQMDEPTLLKFISDNALPARIIDTDGNRLDLDGLRKSVADAYSVKAIADARLIADAVIKANDAGQPLTYRNPDGTFKPLSEIIPPKSADIAQAEPVKKPDQPDQPVAPKSPNILDKIAGFFRPAPPAVSDIKPAEIPFTHQDLNRLADNISQGHVTVKPSTDDQGNPVYRLTTQASASQETIDTVDRLNKVISDFEGSFGHPIRQNQLDLLLKPESIMQLQAGGGKTTVMAHLEAIARRNVIFAMPNQTDAESFVRDVQARTDFYTKQGLEVVYYDSNRGFLSIDGDFNITKARQIDFDQISKMADAAQADPTHRGFIIVTTSADNAWGTIRGRQNLSPSDRFIYDAVFGSRDFHLVVDEIGSVVQGEYSVSQGKPVKLSQITDSNQIYGYKKVSDLISASKTVDNIDQVKKLLSQVQDQLSKGGSNRDLFFEFDGITRPYPKDPSIVNSSYASLIDVALVRANGKISPQFEAELRAIAQKLTDPQTDSEVARKLFTDTLQKVQQGDDVSVLTDLSYMTSYLQSKWHIMSMVPGNNFGLEFGDLVIRKLGGTSGEKFSQITDLIAMQTDGLAMLRSAGIDIGNDKIAPIGDLTYTPDSFKISNLEILRAKAASGKLAGYDATPDTAARAIGVLATDSSERPKNPTNFAVDENMAQLIKKGIDSDYITKHSNQALAVVIADDGVSYENTTDTFLSRQMELRGQNEITLARTKYKTELEGDQKTEYFFETVTRNADGTVIRKITDTFTDQDSWGAKIHQSLAQDPQKIAIVFEGRTRAVDLKVEDTSKLVAWTVIASDSNTMEDITQAWKRNRVAAGTGAAETWDESIKTEFSQYSLLVRSGNTDLTADNIIDIYQTRLIEKLARDNFDITLRQIAETPKSGIDTVRSLLSDRSDFAKISADLDTVLTNVDRVIRASVTEIFYKPLDSDQIADVVYNRGKGVYDQLKSGVDTIVDQYKLTTQEAEVIRRQLGIDEPYIARTTFDQILASPARTPDLSLIGPSGLVRNWAMTNTKTDLPKYAWAQSADADTVAIQTEVIRQSIVQERLVDVQTRVNQIADSLGKLEIPRGYDITTGLTANLLQTTLGIWSGKNIATAVSHISSQVNSGQITTQSTLIQALQLNLTPLIDDTVLRQAVIDSIMSGPVAQSLKADDVADSATADQAEEPAQVQQPVEQQAVEEPVTVPAQAQVSQDTIDKANTLRTTSKGSQESVEDYTNRINSLWQERQQLIDTAQALHLELQASIGDQPWSTFKTRATSYISQAQKLNQQAQDISLDLGTGLLTISDMSAAVKAKQTELDAQRQATVEAERQVQEALNAIKQKAKNLGATDKELSEATTQDDVKKLIDKITKEVLDAQQEAYDKNINISAAGRLVGRPRRDKINEIITQTEAQQQAEQIAKALADAKQQAKTDFGVTVSGQTLKQVETNVNQIKADIAKLETDSGLKFRSVNPSETFSAFKTRAQTEITNQARQKDQAEAQAKQAEEEAKAIQALINSLSTPLQDIDLTSDNSDTLQQSLDSLTKIQQQLQSNPLYQTNSDLQQLNTNIQSKIDQVKSKIASNQTEVDQIDQQSSSTESQQAPFNYTVRDGIIQPDTTYNDDQYVAGLEWLLIERLKLYDEVDSVPSTSYLPTAISRSGITITSSWTSQENQTYYRLIEPTTKTTSPLSKFYVYPKSETNLINLLSSLKTITDELSQTGVGLTFKYFENYIVFYFEVDPLVTNFQTYSSGVSKLSNFFKASSDAFFVGAAEDPVGSYVRQINGQMKSDLINLSHVGLSNDSLLDRIFYPSLVDVLKKADIKTSVLPSDNYDLLVYHYKNSPDIRLLLLKEYRKLCTIYIRNPQNPSTKKDLTLFLNISDPSVIPYIKDLVANGYSPIIIDATNIVKSETSIYSLLHDNVIKKQGYISFDNSQITTDFITLLNSLRQKQSIVAQPSQLALPAPQSDQPLEEVKQPLVRTPVFVQNIIDRLTEITQSVQQSLQVATTASITAWIKINEILTTINQKVSSMSATDFSSYQWQEGMTKDDFISQNQHLIVALFESSGLTADLRSTSGITDQEFESYIQGLGGQLYQKIKDIDQLRPLTPLSPQDYRVMDLSPQDLQILKSAKTDRKQPALTRDLLSNPTYFPVKKIIIEGRQYFFISKVIYSEHAKRYESILFSLNDQDLVLPRPLWLSNSDGGWRATPGYISGLYSKGRDRVYTQETKIHQAILRLLNEQKNDPSQVIQYSGKDSLVSDMFLLATLEKQGINTYESEQTIYDDHGLLSELQKYPAGTYSRNKPTPRIFELFSYPAGFVPDFTQSPIKSETSQHTLLGDITLETYPATLDNRPIFWVMAYDKSGKVWIDRIIFADSKLTSYGTYSEIIDSGALVNKPLEYSSQSAQLILGQDYLPIINNPTYVDITPLLDHLKPIRDFRSSRGILKTFSSEEEELVYKFSQLGIKALPTDITNLRQLDNIVKWLTENKIPFMNYVYVDLLKLYKILDSLKSKISQLETQLGIRSLAKFDSKTGIPISTDNLTQRLQDLSIVSRVRHIYSQIQTSLQTYLVNYLSQQINTLMSSRSFSSPEQLHLFIRQAFDQTFTLIKKGRHPRPYDDTQMWLWNTVALQIVALDTDKQLSDSQVRSITNQLAMSFSSSQPRYYQSVIDNLSYQTSQASNIFATSDIHGDWDQFVKLASQTKPDSPAVLDKKGNWIAPQGTRLLVLGDMLDRAPRGKHSYQVVENMMSLQKRAGKDSQGNDNVVVLMGNHELIMLKVLDIFGNMLNSGLKKQEAANIASSPNVSGFGFNIDPQDILYLYDHPNLVSWIKSLPFIIQVDNSLYFHSNSYDYRNFGSSIDEINANLRHVVENGSHQIKNPLTDSTKSITKSDLAGLITQGEGYRKGSILKSGLVNSILKTFSIPLDQGKIIHGHDQREGMTGRTLDPRVTNVDSGMSSHYSQSSDRGTFKIVDQNTTIANASIKINQVVSFDPDGCSSCALVRRKVEDFIDQAKKKGKDAIEWTWAFSTANDHDFRNDPEQFELNFLIWLHSFFVRQDKSSLRMANLWGQRTTDVILELITQGGLDPLSLIDLNLRLARVEQQLEDLKDVEVSPSSPLVVVKDNLIELRNLFDRTFGKPTSDTTVDLSLDLPFTNNSQTTIDEFGSTADKDFWQTFNNLPDDTSFFHIQDIGSTAQVWSLDLNILLKDYQSIDDLVFETFNLADLKSFIQENNLDLETIIAPDLSNPLRFLLQKRQILPPQLIKTYLMTDDGAWIEASLHSLDNTNTLSPLPGDIYYFSTNIEHIDNYFYVFYNHNQNSFIFLNYGPSWFGIKTGATQLQTDDTFNLFGKTFEYKILPDGSIQITISNSSPLSFINYFLPCQGEDRGGVLNPKSNLGCLSNPSISSTNSPLQAFV